MPTSRLRIATTRTRGPRGVRPATPGSTHAPLLPRFECGAPSKPGPVPSLRIPPGLWQHRPGPDRWHRDVPQPSGVVSHRETASSRTRDRMRLFKPLQLTTSTLRLVDFEPGRGFLSHAALIRDLEQLARISHTRLGTSETSASWAQSRPQSRPRAPRTRSSTRPGRSPSRLAR
jgi:hypothetical protein